MTGSHLLALGVAVFIAFLFYMFNRPKTRQPSPLKLSQSGTESNTTSAPVKELNVIFQYNGHDFDAYQVLGVPAGASQEAVRKAYDQAVATADPDSREFLEHAYRSICKS